MDTSFSFKNTIVQAVDGFEWFVKTVGVRLPSIGATSFSILGSLLFSGIDIIAGGIFLSWAISFFARPQDVALARFLGWALSISIYYVVYQIGHGLVEKDQWITGSWNIVAKIVAALFAIALNTADSFIDGCAIFILFGATSIVKVAGLQGVKEAFSRIPLIGWIIFCMIFSISFLAEPWRQFVSYRVE